MSMSAYYRLISAFTKPGSCRLKKLSLAGLLILGLVFPVHAQDLSGQIHDALTSPQNAIVFDGADGSQVQGIRCGTPSPTPQEEEQVRNAIEQFRQQNNGILRKTGTVVIPVAFHVVRHDDGSADVTDQQIQDQLQVLNDAYGPYGYQFTHHSTDRTDNSLWSQNSPGSAAEYAMKNALAIDPASTLNLYICDLGGGLLGYSYFPNSFDEDSIVHGVVVLYSSLPGGSAYPYDEGDTATHEIGHYLGLYHTFQNGCFTPGDQVDDTPYEAQPASGCPVGADTCPNRAGLDPIHNFMDYSIDSCMYEFTAGQQERMDTMVELYRPTLFYGGLNVDVKANNQDGLVQVSTSDSVDLTVSLSPGNLAGQTADWAALVLPLANPTWIPLFGFQTELIEVSQTSLFNNPLPAGWYVFLFNVDTNADGQIQLEHYDYVIVGVTP